MQLVRQGKRKVRGSGFVVTWDVDSKNRSRANRLWAFLHGRRVVVNGKEYRYPGFVEREGVRYLGQSVVFVRPACLRELIAFLSSQEIEHDIDSTIFP